MTPEISVVIPTRDRTTLLRRSLQTALAQRDVVLEVIVVDDGSTDDLSVVVGELADSRVVLLRHEQSQGVAAARNKGVCAATGEWIAFLDDDDLWSPDKLATQLTALRGQPGGRWSAVGAVIIDAQLTPRTSYSPPDPATLINELLRYNVIPGGGSGVVANAAFVREVGAFDPALSILADWDLWIRLARSGPLTVVDRPLVAYALHDTNMSNHPDHVLEELARVEDRYREDREVAGVSIDRERWLDWIAYHYRRSGQRGASSHIYIGQALRLRRPRLAARALAAFCWPGLADRRDRRRIRNTHDGARGESFEWVAAGRATPET